MLDIIGLQCFMTALKKPHLCHEHQLVQRILDFFMEHKEMSLLEIHNFAKKLKSF